ncbi:MAG: fibronectin type III domain-containing protein [Clostridium sp.]|nr:fibronectin type III domain-containing protein [Clostridium sp.]
MKKTIRLGSFLLAFLLLVCTLPVTAWAATTVDLNQNYLFRPRDNAFSFGAGETAALTFTPQYTAEYTLNLYGHGDGGGGRNIKASLTKPDGTVTDFKYPKHEGTTDKNYARPFLTAKLEKGKTYIYSVTGKIASTSATVDVNLTSSQSGALTEELGLRAYLQGKTVFNGYNPQAVLNELKLLVGFKNATQPLEWYYKNAGGVLSINGVDVIVDMSGCGAEGMNTMAVYYQGYRAEAKFEIRSHEHNYEAGDSVLPTCTTAGYTPYFCTICADEVHRDIVPALGHNYKEKSRALTKATTSKDGKRTATYACTHTGCKATYTKTLQTYYKVNTIKLNKTAYTYNGKVQKPSVTVKNSKGKTLKNGTDYKISYPKGMKNVGKYTVKVTLKGNYSGTKSLTYNINPKGTSVSKVKAAKKGFKVTWKKQATQTTGYQVQYSTSSKFKSAKTVTISKNKTTSKSVSKLSAKKKYYVRVRTYKTVKVNGKNVKLYSGWSKAKSVTTKK